MATLAAQFPANHGLAELALLVFTGGRGSDVVKFGPKLVKNEVITFKLEKTSKSTAKVLNLPTSPACARLLTPPRPAHKPTLTDLLRREIPRP